MTEHQKFEIVQKYSNFELRSYDACVIAQVEMAGNYNSSISGAFGYLFKYISKGNESSSSIAMTAPVIAATQGDLDSNKWRVSFVMPAGSSINDVPSPIDSKVILSEIPKQECVALGFRGRATLDLSARKEAELRLHAKVEGFTLSRETRICRFDPPFKPGFMQYNEIVIPIETSPL